MKSLNKFIMILICLGMLNQLKAQIIDTSYSSILRNEILTLKYKRVVSNNTQAGLQALSKLNTPFYILTQKDFDFWLTNIKYSHLAINGLDSAIQGLKLTNTVDNQIKLQLDNVIAQTNNRVELYRNAYEESLNINEAYSVQLGECIEISKKKASPRKLETFVWGSVLGVIVGAITTSIIVR